MQISVVEAACVVAIGIATVELKTTESVLAPGVREQVVARSKPLDTGALDRRSGREPTDNARQP